MLKTVLLVLPLTLIVLLTAACSSFTDTAETDGTVVATTPAAATLTSIAPTSISPTSTATTAAETTEVKIVAAGCSESLAAYLADPLNGQSVADRGVELNGGQGHNACVFTVAEALRRVGCDIPETTGYTPVLVQQLKDRDFSISYQLSDLQPGDICFTTNEQGGLDGVSTHTFIFLAWEGQDTMRIFDNQSYDYGSPFHSRSVKLTYFNDQADRPKEATAFYMRKE